MVRDVPQIDVVILADPLNDVPFIVLAVCNLVAVFELPVHEPELPDTFTPERVNAADPLFIAT